MTLYGILVTHYDVRPYVDSRYFNDYMCDGTIFIDHVI